MTTTDDGARAGEIEGRVVDWVTATLAASGTTDGVGVQATASRAPSLPDDGLEVRPEDWTVAVELRLSEADEAKAADLLTAIADASGTVTLDSGEAAEIAPIPDSAGAGAERVEDAPEDKPFRSTTSVAVSIPWPSRNDAAADPA